MWTENSRSSPIVSIGDSSATNSVSSPAANAARRSVRHRPAAQRRASAPVASRAGRRTRGSRSRAGRSSTGSSCDHGFSTDKLGYPNSGLSTCRGTKRRRGIAAAALLFPIVLAGCGGSQSTLNPHSHAATDIANLFWVMMAVSFGGLALITGMLVWAWVRRGRRGFGADPDDPHPGEKQSWWVVIGMGVVFPLTVIVALFIVGDWAIINVTQAPAASSTALTVDAIGHQWYWEFRYPGTTGGHCRRVAHSRRHARSISSRRRPTSSTASGCPR